MITVTRDSQSSFFRFTTDFNRSSIHWRHVWMNSLFPNADEAKHACAIFPISILWEAACRWLCLLPPLKWPKMMRARTKKFILILLVCGLSLLHFLLQWLASSFYSVLHAKIMCLSYTCPFHVSKRKAPTSGLEYLKMAYNSYYVMFYDYYSISSRGFIRKWIYNNFYAILNLQNRKSNHKRREFRCISLAWWGPTKFGLGDGPYFCFECLEFGRLLHRKVRFLS